MHPPGGRRGAPFQGSVAAFERGRGQALPVQASAVLTGALPGNWDGDFVHCRTDEAERILLFLTGFLCKTHKKTHKIRV